MDKYEFNLRIDQIKKKIASEDFETAMKIADTIDWRRVRNINILSMVSGVYEKNGEYQEAKDILLLALNGPLWESAFCTSWPSWQLKKEVRMRQRIITGNFVSWLRKTPDSTFCAI